MRNDHCELPSTVLWLKSGQHDISIAFVHDNLHSVAFLAFTIGLIP